MTSALGSLKGDLASTTRRFEAPLSLDIRLGCNINVLDRDTEESRAR